MKITKENDLIVRHNNLINANIRLDAKEYDVVRTFMKYITRDDGDFWTFTVRASELNINKSRGAPMVRSIQRKPVEIELPNDGLVSIPFFTSLKYSNGVFEGKFNNDLRDVLLEMQSNFTKTYERYILPMSSIYAKRIYELLSENIKIGYRKFKLDDLYKTLQVKKSMQTYPNFKKFVLLIAIKEINKHSDIYIPVDTTNLQDESWTRLQCGVKRGVTHLNFMFRKKSDKGLFSDDMQPKEIEEQNQELEQLAIHEELEKQIDKDYLFLVFDCTTIEQKRAVQIKIDEFVDYVIEKEKDYKDLTTSCLRYLNIARKNNWDF
jgi:plasmid replication initiation protein